MNISNCALLLIGFIILVFLFIMISRRNSYKINRYAGGTIDPSQVGKLYSESVNYDLYSEGGWPSVPFFNGYDQAAPVIQDAPAFLQYRNLVSKKHNSREIFFIVQRIYVNKHGWNPSNSPLYRPHGYYVRHMNPQPQNLDGEVFDFEGRLELTYLGKNWQQQNNKVYPDLRVYVHKTRYSPANPVINLYDVIQDTKNAYYYYTKFTPNQITPNRPIVESYHKIVNDNNNKKDLQSLMENFFPFIPPQPAAAAAPPPDASKNDLFPLVVNGNNGSQACYINAPLYAIVAFPQILYNMYIKYAPFGFNDLNISDQISYLNIYSLFLDAVKQKDKWGNDIYKRIYDVAQRYITVKDAVPKWTSYGDAAVFMVYYYNVLVSQVGVAQQDLGVQPNIMANSWQELAGYLDQNAKITACIIKGTKCVDTSIGYAGNASAYHYITFVRVQLTDIYNWYRYDSGTLTQNNVGLDAIIGDSCPNGEAYTFTILDVDPMILLEDPMSEALARRTWDELVKNVKQEVDNDARIRKKAKDECYWTSKWRCPDKDPIPGYGNSKPKGPDDEYYKECCIYRNNCNWVRNYSCPDWTKTEGYKGKAKNSGSDNYKRCCEVLGKNIN